MTHQEHVLPEDDREMCLAWELSGKSYAELARIYGCSESAVRKRMNRIRKKEKKA